MSTHNIHFMLKYENFPKISINICFLYAVVRISLGLKNEFELATANKPSVFKSFTVFFCGEIRKYTFWLKQRLEMCEMCELCMVTYMRQSSVITLV